MLKGALALTMFVIGASLIGPAEAATCRNTASFDK